MIWYICINLNIPLISSLSINIYKILLTKNIFQNENFTEKGGFSSFQESVLQMSLMLT